MAIHPIDLQTMYAQMNNVARTVANSQQGAQLAQQLQENKIIQQNLEQAHTVKKAANDEAKSTGVTDEGHRGSQQENNKRKNASSQENPQKETEIRESYLGQHIDITR